MEKKTMTILCYFTSTAYLKNNINIKQTFKHVQRQASMISYEDIPMSNFNIQHFMMLVPHLIQKNKDI
jgi:hypothetical protein